jgi:hypothetical protein
MTKEEIENVEQKAYAKYFNAVIATRDRYTEYHLAKEHKDYCWQEWMKAADALRNA